MKTFEEQFTAWMDDCLPDDEHAAFERALADRPDADALRAEKRATRHLRTLLRDHLHAPALSNPDFFNHGIMERIAAEERDAFAAAPRRRAAASWWQWDWTPARLLAAGAACLLAAFVGVRALIPTGGGQESVKTPVAVVLAPDGDTATKPLLADTTNQATPGPDGAPRGPGSKNDGVEAKLNVPAPVVPVEPSPTPAESSTVTATPLHFDDGDADVIWLDGPDYLPNLDAAPPAPSPTAPAPR